MKRPAGFMLAALLVLPAWNQEDAAMRKLLAEDQAARAQPMDGDAWDLHRMAAQDRIRRLRAALACAQDQVRDPATFADIAVLFQHGDQPDDYLAARELSLLAAFHGRQGGLPACAEDRFLLVLGRPQRFGTQTGPGRPPLDPANLDRGPWAVADRMRADALVPPLALALAVGPCEAATRNVQALERHLQLRLAPSGPARSVVRSRLEALARLPHTPKGRARLRQGLLRLHRLEGFWLPADYDRAATLLDLAARAPAQRLLANEWAAISLLWGHRPAWRTFTRTWDHYATATGLAPRYGTGGTPPAASVAPAVLRMLQAEDKPAPP